MDQNYNESIAQIKTDIADIEKSLLSLDAHISNSAKNLAEAATKLNAATPNDMTSVLDKNTTSLNKFVTAINKAQKLDAEYSKKKEKEAELQAKRAAKEAADLQKLNQAKQTAAEKAIAQKQKEAAAAEKSSETIAKAAERERLAEIKLQQAREKAFDKFEGAIRKKAAAAQSAAEKEKAIKDKEFRDFEKQYNKYIENLGKKAAAEKVALENAKKSAEQARLAEIRLQQAREKAFDDYDKKLANQRIAEKKEELYRLQRNQKYLDDLAKEAAAKDKAFKDKAADAQRQAANDARNLVNQKALAEAADLEAKATSKLVGAYANLQAKREQARRTLQNLIASGTASNQQIKEASKRYNEYTARLNAATVAQQRLNSVGMGGMVQGLTAVWGSLKNIMAAFGIIGGLYLFADQIKQAYQLVRQLDSLNFAMKTIITDSKELARTQAFIADITERYGAALVTTTERYIKFLAAAKQSNVTLEDTERIFGTVTKAAGALGLKSHELEGIYLALEQMLSKGKVTTEELRRQLGERLPGAFGIMAQALGVTVGELDKMLRAGEVLSSDALPKFATALERAYGIENLNRVENLNAATTRMSNSWVALVGSITNSEGPISKAFVSIINSGNEVIDHLRILNTSLSEMFNKGKDKGEFEIMEILKKDVDELGISMERAAEKRLPEFQKQFAKTSEEVEKLKKKLEDKDVFEFLLPGIGHGIVAGLENRLKKTGELMAKEQEMLAVIKSIINAETERRDIAVEPLNLKNFDDVTAVLNQAKAKYEEATEKVEEFKNSGVHNPKRLEDLEIEQYKVAQLVEQYTLLRDSFESTQFDFSKDQSYNPTKNYADRIFIYEKLTAAKEKYEQTSGGDNAGREAIQAEIDILEKALEIWDGAPKKKEKAVKAMKDTSMEDAFSLQEGRLKRELEIQQEIRDNEENSLVDRLNAFRAAYDKEIDLLEWRKAEAVRQAKGRHDLIKSLEEQFQYDRYKIMVDGEKRIEEITGEDFDKRIDNFDKRLAADKFAMEKEVENIRRIGIARGQTTEAIERQVLEVKEIYLQKNLEAQLEYALKELKVLAANSDQEIEIEKRILDLRQQLHDVQLKNRKENEEDEKESLERRQERIEDYLNAVGDIGLAVGDLFKALSNRRLNDIDEQLQASNDMYASLLENEHLTAEQRIDLQEEQKRREDELNEKKRKERIKQAQAEKKFALFEIAVNTAIEISKVLAQPWLVALVAVMGALQAATVMATPIPKYAKGRRGGPEEYAWLGDGGKNEAVLDRNQKLKGISPDTPTLVKLKQGDIVLSDTKQLKPENFTEKQVENVKNTENISSVKNIFSSEENNTIKYLKPTYLTHETIHNDYSKILNSTIHSTLANASGNFDSDKLAKIFDQKLSSLKEDVNSGIKNGFSNVKMPKNDGMKQLANRLKFYDMRDAI